MNGLPVSAKEIAGYLSAKIVGNPEVLVEGFSSVESSQQGKLTFLAHKKLIGNLKKSSEAVILTQAEWVEESLPHTFLIVDHPQEAFAKVVTKLFERKLKTEIATTAVVSPLAKIEEGVEIGAFAVVEAYAEIGSGSKIYPHAYIGESVKIGKNCEIFPFASILEKSELGNRVKIFSGAVIGGEGFGFFQSTEGLTPMPQLGKVVLEDDVRIGANSTIDRATLETTRLKKGVKIDNLVQIAHNCEIGEYSILCSQSGIGGSSILGKNVILGGQAGLSDHVKVGDNARLGAQAGSGSDLESNETYFMSPAVPIKESLKVIKHLRKIGRDIKK